MRIHTSPSIQITEIDKSQYSPSMTGTKVYIQGFSAKGEAYKPMDITSRTAYTTIYGEPTTEAERYAYACVCEVLNNNGKVCFARLPYDNESFEKMIAYKYMVSDLTSNLSETKWNAIAKADNEIQQYCTINAYEHPYLIDLSSVEEYRTDEAKVKAGHFIIVDTTGSTLGKITEDYRKGTARELIGIVPVVTTAANALLAQSMITVENHEVSAYESIEAKQLGTIKGKDGKYRNLLQSDLNGLINTTDFYYEQTHSFDAKGITLQWSGEEVDFGNTVGTWFAACREFIAEHKYDYTLNNLDNMREFYNFLVDEENPDWKKAELSDTVEELRLSCKAMIDSIAATSAWYWVDDAGKLSPLSAMKDGNDETIQPSTFDELKQAYVELTSSGTPEFACKKSFINPASVKIGLNDENALTGQAQVNVATKFASAGEGEWHGKNGDDSLPATMCQDANGFFASIQPASDGDGIDPEHLKDIGVVVFKTYLDPAVGNKVSYEPVEAFCGSLYKDDKDPNTGVTKFIDAIVNTQSEYINFFSNCFSTTRAKKDYIEKLDILIAEPSYGASLGFFEYMTKKDISISKSILDGMNKAQTKVSDLNARDIDIVPDAGLANIASYLKALYGDKGEYDLTVTDDLGNSMLGLWKCKDPTSPAVKMWRTVEQKLDNFCKNVRKDCMFVADGLRPLVLQGQKKIIRDSKPTSTLDKDVLPYLKCIAGLNTSYGAGYMDWFEQADDYTGDFFWCPPSIKATGVYINTDVNYNYWDAPAGLNRGVIPCTDVAFSPTAFQADLIYDKCWNYAIHYPNDGIVLEGQRTLQTKPSALDRVNVRRLLLRLERATYQTVRWFLYEGNTAYLRQRVVDALDPYFKQAKVGGGLYDYLIKCDESNNTPETIDNNELHISIGVKPVKAVEYIMVDFIIGRTGSSWAELGL